MRTLLITALLASVGCATCPEKVLDLDGDGYGDDADGDGVADIVEVCDDNAPAHFPGNELGPDCNDGNADINPAGTELCNDIDDDCDGEVDEGASDARTFYADTDGDGFGDAANSQQACTAGDGFVSDPTDCDDADAAINPDATEVCDEVDNDCNGTVDEGTAADAIFWHADADGDGYGNPDSTRRACSPPDGYVEPGDDCNDTDDTVHPGAEEVRCDGSDNDCDPATATLAGILEEDGSITESLGEAVFRARPGEVIQLCEGAFTGPVNLRLEQGILGIGGAELTTITGDGSGPVVTIVDAGTVSGVTLTGGVGAELDGVRYGGAVYASGEGIPRLDDVILHGNSADVGGAVFADTTSFDLRNCHVFDNSATQRGGGVAVGSTDLSARGSTIEANEAPRCGGVSTGDGAVFRGRDSLIRDHVVTEEGGGMCLGPGARISTATITGNRARSGGGVYAQDGAQLGAADISDNSATSDGGGVYAVGSLGVLSSSVTDNVASAGGGFYLTTHEGEGVLIESGVVARNESSARGGGVFMPSGTLTVTGTDFATGDDDNTPVDVTVRDSGGTSHDFTYDGEVDFHCAEGACELLGE